MTHLNIEDRDGWPMELQTLLRDYPREAWPDHPNFAHSIQNWMGAHQMFKNLASFLTKDTEKYIDNNKDPKKYAGNLSYYGNALLRNLLGHHHWEDHSYFPEISVADHGFDHGLESLEKDHIQLDEILNEMQLTSNKCLKLLHLEEKQAREYIGNLHKNFMTIEKFLNRHLQDEEDLIVPILLHHKMRG